MTSSIVNGEKATRDTRTHTAESRRWRATGVGPNFLHLIAEEAVDFWGHLTSSVMWPFDSPWAISYWWSFGSKDLSLAVN